MAVLLALVVFVGFAPTFYLRATAATIDVGVRAWSPLYVLASGPSSSW
jgi:hypothetical protein